MRGCTAVWSLDIVEARSALETLDLKVGLLDQTEGSIPEQERLTTRRALRVLLRHYVGKDMACAPMRAAESGRPELALPGAPVFSISHTAGTALIALCEAAPLGVDLELQRPLKMSLERRTQLAIGARDAGLSVPAALCEAKFISAESDREFLLVWTQLEALAKARGEGIGAILQAIGIGARLGSGQAAVARNLVPPECEIASLSLDHDFVAAVVHPRTHALEQLRQFPASPAAISAMCGFGSGDNQG